MTHFLDFALPTALVVFGVALTVLEPSSPLLHALGLMAVAGGGFWLGHTVRGSDGE